MGSSGDSEGDWRESAAFDVTPADYRRVFALAVASEGGRDPSFAPMFLRAAWKYWQWCLGFAILGGMAWVLFQYSDDEPLLGKAWDAMVGAGKTVLALTPVALVLGAVAASRMRWRARFPQQAAAWKRPTRMRVRWNDTALVRVGAHGFGSFAWSGLHAWLDTPGELVVFTAMHDPIPIPHGAMAPEDLENLRARLVLAEVPVTWQAMSAGQRGLLRVFR